MKKISTERIRPERSKTRKLIVGKIERLTILVAPKTKKILAREAKKRKMSMSLYINLILVGQEPPIVV